jgi:hypothetical protein
MAVLVWAWPVVALVPIVVAYRLFDWWRDR